MRIEDIYLEPGNPLLKDFFRSFEQVSDFYMYDPKDEIRGFTMRAEYLKHKKDRVPRRQLVQVLRDYHGTDLSHPAIQANLERLEQPDCLVVIGGQQAGLMSGPLYTLYKGMTLIQLAKREEERLGVPVVPVFWIAGEDHDLEEVNHILLPGEKKPIRHGINFQEERRISVGEICLSQDTLWPWVKGLEELLPDSPYKKELIMTLKELLGENLSWTRHFSRIVHHLFGRYGLIQIDSADPALRKLEVPFFQWILDQNQGLEQAVSEQADKMERKGYVPQVELQPGQAHLFIRDQGERRVLFREGDGFRTREGDRYWSKRELEAQLIRSPEDFSNNVITRPLMQEYLFPVLATVLGPGEIAYWGLLKKAFSLADMEMPPLYPRLSLTIVERSVQKQMRRFGLSVYDVFYHLDEIKSTWLQKNLPLDLKSIIRDMKKEIHEIYAPAVQKMGLLRDDLKQIGTRNQEKVLREVEDLEKRAQKVMEDMMEVDLRRFAEMEKMLYPQGELQERLYNILPYWNRYGEEWLHRLIQTSLLSSENHRVVYL